MIIRNTLYIVDKQWEIQSAITTELSRIFLIHIPCNGIAIENRFLKKRWCWVCQKFSPEGSDDFLDAFRILYE